MNKDFGRLLTVKELGLLLGKAPAQIYQMRAEGMAPPAIKIGNGLRFAESDVHAWLESKREKVSS